MNGDNQFDNSRNLTFTTIPSSPSQSSEPMSPREKAERKNQEFFEKMKEQYPLFSPFINLFSAFFRTLLPGINLLAFCGRKMKNPTIFLTLLFIKVAVILAISFFFASVVFVFTYIYFSYPKEFVSKVPFEKEDLGVSGLFFLMSEPDSKNAACSQRTWSFSTYPKENVATLEEACQIHENTAKINSISLEPYKYIVEIVLDLPDTKGNNEIEFLELRMNIVNSKGKTKTFFTSGTHVTSGSSIFRVLTQLVMQQVDHVYFNTQDPVLKNEDSDLLMLSLEIWEKNLVVEEATILLHPVIPGGVQYYMTYYFWVFGVLLSVLVFFFNAACLGGLLLIFEIIYRWTRPASNKTKKE